MLMSELTGPTFLRFATSSKRFFSLARLIRFYVRWLHIQFLRSLVIQLSPKAQFFISSLLEHGLCVH